MAKPEETEVMAAAWVEILDAEKIPETAYEALYNGAMRKINATIADGRKAPDFNVNLLASVWKSDRNLRDEFTPKSTYLIGSMGAGCSRCHGTGWEYVVETYPREVARCRCGKIPGR